MYVVLIFITVAAVVCFLYWKLLGPQGHERVSTTPAENGEDRDGKSSFKLPALISIITPLIVGGVALLTVQITQGSSAVVDRVVGTNTLTDAQVVQIAQQAARYARGGRASALIDALTGHPPANICAEVDSVVEAIDVTYSDGLETASVDTEIRGHGVEKCSVEGKPTVFLEIGQHARGKDLSFTFVDLTTNETLSDDEWNVVVKETIPGRSAVTIVKVSPRMKVSLEEQGRPEFALGLQYTLPGWDPLSRPLSVYYASTRDYGRQDVLPSFSGVVTWPYPIDAKLQYFSVVPKKDETESPALIVKFLDQLPDGVDIRVTNNKVMIKAAMVTETVGVEFLIDRTRGGNEEQLRRMANTLLTTANQTSNETSELPVVRRTLNVAHIDE